MSITKHAHLEEWTKIMKQETVQMSEDNPESKPQKTMFQEAGCGLKYQSLQRCYGGWTLSKGHHIWLKEHTNGILEQSQGKHRINSDHEDTE